jgi:hypothetical protein
MAATTFGTLLQEFQDSTDPSTTMAKVAKLLDEESAKQDKLATSRLTNLEKQTKLLETISEKLSLLIDTVAYAPGGPGAAKTQTHFEGVVTANDKNPLPTFEEVVQDKKRKLAEALSTDSNKTTVAENDKSGYVVATTEGVKTIVGTWKVMEVHDIWDDEAECRICGEERTDGMWVRCPFDHTDLYARISQKPVPAICLPGTGISQAFAQIAVDPVPDLVMCRDCGIYKEMGKGCKNCK